VKRFIDFIISACCLLVFSPLFLICFLAIKLSGGPVIYKQERIGLHGKPFYIYKFRSMKTNAEENGEELLQSENDPRLTKVGRFLRSHHLDELPQLWNVFIGDMSLVGPRPPVPSEVAQYTLEDRKRLDVIPGITCLWQIKGRSEIPFHEQVRLDKEYILAPSVWKDIAILLKTVPAIIGGKGAY
jgi:lipopolysaccharide/colanic/teichoic acid biosynthesis glycosyltransferase